ncbi:MAG: hypothetical protein CFH01_00748 [Alphaproteobacteria bacterium MarineAlpha2_Bin1]|nr:MAG: hypothetical protein CFH01_00748 [Alphaproteobacteria bacterium MarineAlpha2_Bin1]
MVIAENKRKLLVIVDDTPECRKSLRFACRRASRTQGTVLMLKVIYPADFQHWLAVEERMRQEAKDDATDLLSRLCHEIKDQWGIETESLIVEGKTDKVVMDLIDKNLDIKILVLGSASGADGPGPLVSQLVGRSSGIRIPVTVVPGDLTDDQIDELS